MGNATPVLVQTSLYGVNHWKTALLVSSIIQSDNLLIHYEVCGLKIVAFVTITITISIVVICWVHLFLHCLVPFSSSQSFAHGLKFRTMPVSTDEICHSYLPTHTWFGTEAKRRRDGKKKLGTRRLGLDLTFSAKTLASSRPSTSLQLPCGEPIAPCVLLVFFLFFPFQFNLVPFILFTIKSLPFFFFPLSPPPFIPFFFLSY